MNKKGFTLPELLAVIALLAIISLISIYSIDKVRSNIDKKMLNDKIQNIEAAAVYWGEDNKSELTGECTIDGINNNKCVTKTVGELLNNNYLESDAKDGAFINDVTKLDMKDDKVFVYIDNNRIYASMDCTNFKSNNNVCPDESETSVEE